MPSTVANSDSSSMKHITRRTRSRTSAANSVNLASGVTSRKSQSKRTIGRKDASRCSILPAEERRSLVDCQVILSDIYAPESQSQHLTRHIKEGTNVKQNHNVPKNGTTEENSGQNNEISAQPNSYVTRRTNPRRTKSIRSHESVVETQSNTIDIISEDPHSIIHLDESTIGTKSIAETVEAIPCDDVIEQASEDAAISKSRRGTRRLLLRASDRNANIIDSRKAPKRKSDNVIPPQDMGVSPPKQTFKTQNRVQEVSAESASNVSCTTSLEDIQPGTDRQIINTGTSIIQLDQSSDGAKSIAETADSSQKVSGNGVVVQMPKGVAISTTRRVTRRMSMKAADCNENTINSRKGPKRKSDNVAPAQRAGVCPPTEAPSPKASTTSEANAGQSINIGASTTNRSLNKLNNNAFKILIVSIKRVASALTEAELNRLKYEDTTRNTRVPVRPSNRIRWHPNAGIKIERDTLARARSTMAKPKIVISSPIVEVPESSPVPERKHLSYSYLNVSNTSTTQRDTVQKPHPTTHPPMPLLIEHEDEGNNDVYDFLCSSQNKDVPEGSGTTQKTKQKKGRKVAEPAVKNKRKAAAAAAAKPKAKPPKPKANPFGCSRKSLQKVIKKLGGGPVKQPDAVDYKINMEISKTAPLLPIVADADPQPLESTELPYDDPAACAEISRICQPPMERLATRPPSFPITSTPANRLGMVGNLNAASQQMPASPWRLQDDDIVLPKTRYTQRTKEMIPSYESFATENDDVPTVPSTFVTERRKSPHDATGPFVPMPMDTPDTDMPKQSCEGIVSDKDLLEIEQMYVQLKATSEMSQKLIKAMRTSKKNPQTVQQTQTMRLACLKLKKWYDRSMSAFNRSMRIISNIQGTTERSGTHSPVTCSSPLTVEQQRTLNNFNLSTDRFRSMIDQLQSAINDSDIENRPPATSPLERAGTGLVKGVITSKPPKDVVILPERGDHGRRNPLMPLNVVPLPQRDSPLMSPLAKDSSTTGFKNIRRELQYNKETDSIKEISNNQQPEDNDDVGQIAPKIPALPEPSLCSVVEINDQTTHNDGADGGHSSTECIAEAIPNTQNCFGFDEGDSAVENSVAQVTLPMPLNISHETLQRRLKDMKQLLPKRPFFRTQPKLQHRSSGPTRCPAPKVRVFGSPSKRPQTLREFVASTPRPASASATEQLTVPSKPTNTLDVEAPDVSAIEPIAVEQNDELTVPLFDTPDRPQWLNNSAHQRTYTRVPRRKKKNIYLANLGLDDDSEDEANASDGDPQELSSDTDTDERKQKQKANKRKARRKQPVRVEQTKEFKEFVENFNSMCEQVEQYEMIIE